MEQGSQFKAGGSNGAPALPANNVKPARNPRQQAQPRRRVRLEAWRHLTTRRRGALSFWDLPVEVRTQVYRYFVQPPAPKFLREDTLERRQINKTRHSLFEVSKNITNEWTPYFFASKATHSFQAWGSRYTPHYLETYRLANYDKIPHKSFYPNYSPLVGMWLNSLRQLYYEFQTARVGDDAWEFKQGGADHLASFLFRHKPESLREVVLCTEVAPNSKIFYNFDVGTMPVTHHVWKDRWTATSDGKEGDGWASVQKRFQICAGKDALKDWHVTRRLRYTTEKEFREVGNEMVSRVTLVVKSVQMVFRKYERAPQAVADSWVEFY